MEIVGGCGLKNIFWTCLMPSTYTIQDNGVSHSQPTFQFRIEFELNSSRKLVNLN